MILPVGSHVLIFILRVKVFACIHVCIGCVFLIPGEARRGRQIPLHGVTCECWELNLDPRRAASGLNL